MSGYDLNRNPFLKLMSSRLGYGGKIYPDGSKSVDELRLQDDIKLSRNLYGIKEQNVHLRVNGGYLQQERMIFDKRRSLDRALKYSYQAVTIRKPENEDIFIRALINPDKLKQDYDDKILSVGHEWNFKPGDVFEWYGTDTYWLVYLQDLNEVAYFRGEIRKCSYEIAWQDEDGEHSSYVAVRGPVETKIDYIQKHGISVDNPNYSLNILLPRTEATLKYFRRYSKFYLKGQDPGSQNVCWRVEAIDWISTPGILEINATEYYANETEDDVENGIVGGLIVKEEPNSKLVEARIKGETFIKPKRVYVYEYTGTYDSVWSFDEKYPVIYTVDEDNPKKIYIKWDSTYSGQFILSYGGYEKTIVIESLF